MTKLSRKSILTLSVLVLALTAYAEENTEATVVNEIVTSAEEMDNNFSFKGRRRGGMKFEKVDTYDFVNESQELGLGGFVELGLDVYDFEEKVNIKSWAEPYLKFEVNPIAGSNMYLDGRVSRIYQYNRSEQDRNERKTFEFYAGNIFEKNNFFVNYKFGVRHQEFNTGDYKYKATLGTNANNGQPQWQWNNPNSNIEKRTEWRFIPRASYTFNDEFSWFLRGYMSYVDVNVSSTPGNRNAGSPGPNGTNPPNPVTNNPNYTGISSEYGYSHRLESGFAYRVNSDLRISLSAINAEYTGSYINEKTDWVGLAKAEYRLHNTKTLMTEVYAWAFWMPETVVTNRQKQEFKYKDENALRLGLKTEWNFAPDWSLRPEIFGVYFKKSAGGGTGAGASGTRQREFEMVYRLGVRYYF